MTPLDTTIPESALVILIGASGAGKSTLAATWPATQVLSLDHLRGVMSDDPGCQHATQDAADALAFILERRMARHLNTVIDATNVERPVRAKLIAAAQRHAMPTVALIVDTPASVCVDRQKPRPANRRVPVDVVLAQHKAMVHAHPRLAREGFDHIVYADSLDRLEPFLRRLSDDKLTDPGLNGSDGLGDLLLPRRLFGPEILPLWRWKPGSPLAGGDRVAEIRLGKQYLTLAFRENVDGEGNIGFDVLLPCPADSECTGCAWAPVYSITDLHRAVSGVMDNDPDITCTVHGPHDDEDQDDDSEGRADLEAQYADAVRV
ncbi:AAA family ATPase [Streptomyces triculaminicus]|uniref:AAA family ATPase n=1 Tax=Streptomyces triculaminicus TaxID=2816232 RepID=UPI0037D12637